MAVVATVVISLPLQRVVFRRIYGFGDLQQVLATIALTFLMIASINLWQGASLLSIPLHDALKHSVGLGFRTFPMHRVLVISVGVASILGLWLLMDRTLFAYATARGCRQSRHGFGAGDRHRLDIHGRLRTWRGTGRPGRGRRAEILPIAAYFPIRYMVLFLIVVAVGGMGSIAGSFIAALGLLETATRYSVPDFATIVFFSFVILLLALRPHGLLGRSDT